MAGIYAHIPFCHSKCAYCDFYSMPNASLMPRLAQAIRSEMQLRSSEIAEPFSTIYLGGGTPSLLPLGELELIANGLMGYVAPGALREFTIEANPEDVDAERAAAWRAMGIDRVSMGVQSLCDAELAAIGRRHTAKQALAAVGALREAAFGNLSLDLIYGLPGQSLQSWRESLLGILALRPAHFSAYLLSYEPRTRLTAMLKKGEVAEASEQLLADMYAMLISEARAAGYVHYEISNFSLPGCEAKHNSSYWTGTPYLGLGPAAHSYDGALRRLNPANLKEYLAKIEGGEAACIIDEEDDDNRFNDRLITSLRTARGLDMSLLPASRKEQLLSDAQPWLATGALTLTGQQLQIPEEKWLISDAILADLVQVDL